MPNALHSATIDLREGGAWRFLETSTEEKSVGFEGTYLAIEPNARLVFTWSKVVAYATGKREATPTSQVDVTFSPGSDGTDVRLVHSRVHDEDTRNAFSGGWAFAFNSMRALLSKSVRSDILTLRMRMGHRSPRHASRLCRETQD